MTRTRHHPLSNTYELAAEGKDAKLWFGHPHDRYTVDPPQERRIPKRGAYIAMIRRLPVVGFDGVLPGMMFFARHVEGTDEFGFDADGILQGYRGYAVGRRARVGVRVRGASAGFDRGCVQ